MGQPSRLQAGWMDRAQAGRAGGQAGRQAGRAGGQAGQGERGGGEVGCRVGCRQAVRMDSSSARPVTAGEAGAMHEQQGSRPAAAARGAHMLNRGRWMNHSAGVGEERSGAREGAAPSCAHQAQAGKQAGKPSPSPGTAAHQRPRSRRRQPPGSCGGVGKAPQGRGRASGRWRAPAPADQPSPARARSSPATAPVRALPHGSSAGCWPPLCLALPPGALPHSPHHHRLVVHLLKLVGHQLRGAEAQRRGAAGWNACSAPALAGQRLGCEPGRALRAPTEQSTPATGKQGGCSSVSASSVAVKQM